jgi:hypothetical protein
LANLCEVDVTIGQAARDDCRKLNTWLANKKTDDHGEISHDGEEYKEEGRLIANGKIENANGADGRSHPGDSNCSCCFVRVQGRAHW